MAIVFLEWHLFRGGGSRTQLQRVLELLRESLREQLSRGARSRDRPTTALCQNLLAVEPALWTFLYEEGVEPTNNHSERSVRFLVIMRKICFGTRSEAGSESHSVLPSLLETARRQGKDRIGFLVSLLTEPLAAARAALFGNTS